MTIEFKPAVFYCPHCKKEIDLQEVLTAAPGYELSYAMRTVRERRKTLDPAGADNAAIEIAAEMPEMPEMNDSPMTAGQAITALKEHYNHYKGSLSSLAREMDIQVASLSVWLRGNYKPGAKNLDKIRKYLRTHTKNSK